MDNLETEDARQQVVKEADENEALLREEIHRTEKELPEEAKEVNMFDPN